MNTVNIKVSGSTATASGSIVNGNSDTQLSVTFGSGWGANVTALCRYRVHGVEQERRIPVENGTVEIGEIQETEAMSVVFYTSSRQTMPLVIPCLRSIQDFSGEKGDPHFDYFNHLMWLIHKKEE